MNVRTLKQSHTLISITLLYEPDCDFRIWIHARRREKTEKNEFDAIYIAEKLRAYIEPRIHAKYHDWCGLETNESFVPEPVALVSDPKGVRDAVLFVPIPRHFEHCWSQLYQIVAEEGARIAKQSSGRFFISHPFQHPEPSP